MLGLLIIFFIGKYYYKLAEDYNKSPWLFAVIGVISYYVGAFIAGILLGILSEIFGWNIDFENNLGLGLIALPFGIGFSYLLHTILKSTWKEQHQRNLEMEMYATKATRSSYEEE